MVSAKEREIIKDQSDGMLRDGIIRPSSIPLSFPVKLVKKRDGVSRITDSYRPVLKRFVQDTSLEKTAKAVRINSERIDDFERRLDLCVMKQRENNLIFYGIEGKEGEAPTDTRAIIMNLISEKMQIQQNITIQQCRRLTKNANSPILIEVPEHNERIMLFKNRTISRRLVANGLHSCRPLRRLPLTPPNRRQRLEWCRARSTWMTEWHRVVFSDESRFCLSSDSLRVRVWRRRGERSNPAAIVERPTVRQRGIMVWGAIAYDSRSPLLRIQGTMTAQRYVDDVLRPVTLPYLQGVPNALYQQDNARPHTARISQQALQDVQMLPWPPYSPDFSPIEHVWDIIGTNWYQILHVAFYKPEEYFRLHFD
ncbi:Transposase [Cordylochernes scorpioides]|uniref:Transposase n=1 Tax=Cordylochernes scorpioides TaxID=51811 RepID=A0ABY6JVP2_9ARAC|nr:Transposase [Cordylochernes scorpioides]